MVARHDDAADRALPTFDGRYVAGTLIGRGGSSVVYAARDLVLGREVAVKLFTASARDADQLRAEEREARMLAALDHRALTTVFDAGVDTSDPDRPRAYLVMERMQGGDLRARLERGALPPAQVACLGVDLAKGLQHLHRLGLLHRDVKPANVLLAADRADGRLHGKLSDLGISSPIDAPQSESTRGTAAYISPEQAAGVRASPASDVYALGLVLLEAVTGVVEFRGSPDTAAVARLERDAQVPDHVPAGLAVVLVSMLQRVPGERADLASVIRALESFARPADAGRPAGTPPEPLEATPDEVFEGIAGLAARLLDAPVARVALLEAGRAGAGAPHERDITGAPVDGGDALWTSPHPGSTPWAIADVHREPRVARSAMLAASPDLRALAAAPLTSHDGRALGALGVLDRRVRSFSSTELRDLAALALLLARHHELHRSLRRVLLPASTGDGAPLGGTTR